MLEDKKTKLHLNFSSLGPGYTVLPGYTSLHIRLPGYSRLRSQVTRLHARLPGYGRQVTHVTGYSKLQVPGYTFTGYLTGF